MKTKVWLIGSFIFVWLCICFDLCAQEKKEKEEEQLQFQEEFQPEKKQPEEEIPDRLKYYKEKYEETFNEPFDVVWRAIKKSLDDIGCMISYEKYQQDDEGFLAGTLKSDFCVFAMGKDTTFQALKRYSYEMPLIRGGIWINGRINYTFRVKENKDGTVHLSFTARLSGFEDFVTHQVHFWKSNGILETKMLERIKGNVPKVRTE
ncbi:MAG: hypothetical protein N2560_01760 [Ignavibacteria bacterium]|nr:hypothetical protein [Ignavibacteria bacterium]